MINYFEILGVREDADEEIIKASYKVLAKKHHPDGTMSESEEAKKKMALINEAYNVLSDKNKRKRHIETLRKQRESISNIDENTCKDHINVKTNKKKGSNRKKWIWVVIILCIGLLYLTDNGGTTENKIEISGDENDDKILETLSEKFMNVKNEINDANKMEGEEEANKDISSTKQGKATKRSVELRQLQATASEEWCNKNVNTNSTKGYTYVEDDKNYFDEIVLNVWYDENGEPIADILPRKLELLVDKYNGNLSKFLKDFIFIDNESFSFEMLAEGKQPNKAMYAMVLNMESIDYGDNYNDIEAFIGTDFITGVTVDIYIEDASILDNIDSSGTVLVLGEFLDCYVFDSECWPVFRGIYCENVKEIVGKEELENKTDGIDLGILGVNTKAEDFVQIKNGKTCFKGKFLEATNRTVGASLLYKELSSNEEVKYVFFVDIDNSSDNSKKNGYIEGDIGEYAYYHNDGKITEDIIEEYTDWFFEKEVVEEVSGKIVRINKVNDNYIICYLKEMERVIVNEKVLTEEVDNEEYIFIGDTIVWDDKLKCTIEDAGIWKSDDYGVNIYIDISLSGEPFTHYNFLLDDFYAGKCWADGNLLAERLNCLVDGEKYWGNDTYKLNYSGKKVSLRIYGKCTKNSYDNAEKVTAEFNTIGNIYIKGELLGNKMEKVSKNVYSSEYIENQMFKGTAGDYICIDAESDNCKGRLEIMEVKDNELTFNLGLLGYKVEPIIVEKKAVIVDENTAVYDDGQGFLMHFEWSDTEYLGISFEGEALGNDSEILMYIVNNRLYYRDPMFNDD